MSLAPFGSGTGSPNSLAASIHKEIAQNSGFGISIVSSLQTKGIDPLLAQVSYRFLIDIKRNKT